MSHISSWNLVNGICGICWTRWDRPPICYAIGLAVLKAYKKWPENLGPSESKGTPPKFKMVHLKMMVSMFGMSFSSGSSSGFFCIKFIGVIVEVSPLNAAREFKWPFMTPARYQSGQISSRPHTTDLPPKWWFRKGIPRLFQGNLGWWNIIPFGQINVQSPVPSSYFTTNRVSHNSYYHTHPYPKTTITLPLI